VCVVVPEEKMEEDAIRLPKNVVNWLRVFVCACVSTRMHTYQLLVSNSSTAQEMLRHCEEGGKTSDMSTGAEKSTRACPACAVTPTTTATLAAKTHRPDVLQCCVCTKAHINYTNDYLILRYIYIYVRIQKNDTCQLQNIQ